MTAPASAPVSTPVRGAAVVAAAALLAVTAFQVLLALGFPLGRAAWGGAQEASSPDLRIVSAVSALALAGAAGVVLGRARFWGNRWSRGLRRLTWVIVVVLALSAVANLASESALERFAMAPVTILTCLLTLIVARSGGSGGPQPRVPAAVASAAVPVRRPASARSVVATLAVPPILFLLVIVAFSVALGAQAGGDPEAISAAVERLVPQMLLAAQVAMLGLLLVAKRRAGLGWRAIGWRPARTADIALGVGVGVVLAVAYVAVLSPLHGELQRTLGDFVAPGRLLASFGTSLPVYFVANVLLAPAVEESLYRGFGLLRLAPPWGRVRALVVTCVLFGLLHWSGGFWYMILTGVVVGLPFGLLALRGRSLAAPFAAHLVLNLLEFVYVASIS